MWENQLCEFEIVLLQVFASAKEPAGKCYAEKGTIPGYWAVQLDLVFCHCFSNFIVKRVRKEYGNRRSHCECRRVLR